jgi:SAM-dependent methyltransferase
MPGVSFDRAVAYYDATRGYAAGTAEAIQQAIVRYAGLGRSDLLLEMGVGTGRIALPFIEDGYRYVGVDISPAMMAELRRKLSPAARRQPRFVLCQADVLDLPLPDARFALVLAVHVFHLVSDWKRAAHEARRVLRPGAPLLVCYEEQVKDEDAPPSPSRSAREAWDTIKRELGYVGAEMQPGFRPDLERYRAELGGEGASVEFVELHRFTYPPLSARDMAERHLSRMYSGDWAMPDEIHRRASDRLRAWLETECPDPDTAFANTGRFVAVVVRW